MKLLKALFICASTAALVSCSDLSNRMGSWPPFSPPVDQAFALDSWAAIVYGRFSTGKKLDFDCNLSLRLVDEDSKQEYLIRFQVPDAVCAIAVAPGRYRIWGCEAGSPRTTRIAKSDYPRSELFEVRSNAATYLGDYKGYLTDSGFYEHWGISEITNRYVTATAELHRKFPNLANVDVVSAAFRPIRAAAGVRRAPGVVR
jgi:hypothetical protein